MQTSINFTTKAITFLFALFIHLAAISQNFSTLTYPMTYNIGVNVDITGGDTIITSGNDAAISPLTAIGFTFNFCGKPYQTFSATEDGFIRLGAIAVVDTLNTIYSTANLPIIAPCWDDMTTGTTGHVTTKLLGTAPNRIRVIQWNTTVPKNINASVTTAFQLQLYENGKINMVMSSVPQNLNNYSTLLLNNFNGRNQSIDIKFTSQIPTAYYNATVGQINTGALSSRLIVLTPDTAVPNKPAQAKAYAGTNCGVITWADSSINEDCFRIYRSTDNINYNFIDAVYSYSKQLQGKRYAFHDYNLTPNQTYFYRITANTLGSNNSDSITVSVISNGAALSGVKKIPGDYSSITEAYEHITCAQIDSLVTLELQPTYDTLIERFPITIDGRYNHQTGNILLIRPSDSVQEPIIISSYPADSSTILIRNTTNLIIDGRPGGISDTNMLVIRSLKNLSGALLIQKASSYNIFRNINFQNRGIDNALSIITILSTNLDSNATSRNVIMNCDLDGKLRFSETLILIKGTNIYNSDSNVLYNNRIRDFKKSGVIIDQYCNNTIIEKNSFYNTSTVSLYQSILANDSLGGILKIKGNYFGGSMPYCMGTPQLISSSEAYGIQLNRKHPQITEIDDNKFSNTRFTSSGGRYYPIMVRGGINKIGVEKGNLFGDTLHTGNIIANFFYAINNEVREFNLKSEHEICNNIVSGIKAEYFSGIYSRAILLSDTGVAEMNIHHNRIGYPNLPLSIYSKSSNGFLNGIYIISSKVEGKVRIHDNIVCNIWSCDSTTYTSGSAINGINFKGLLFSPDNPSTSCTDSLIISNNKVFSLTSSHANVQSYANVNPGINGIWTVCRPDDIGIIDANEVFNIQSLQQTLSHYLTGMTLEGNIIARKNKIHSLNNKTSDGLLSGIVNTGAIQCINNFISIGCDYFGNDINTSVNIRGISSSLDTAKHSSYYNNSIYIGGTSPVASQSCAIALYALAYNQYFPVRNNICVNSRLTHSNNSNQLNSVYYFPSNIISENNIFYYTNPFNGLGFNNNTLLSDSTSIVANPQFINSCGGSNINMRVNVNSPAIGFGKASAVVPDDIDGTNRIDSGSITAGCYELMLDTSSEVLISAPYTTICLRDSVLLTATQISGYNYSWTCNGITVGNNSSYCYATSAGVYVAMVYNNNDTIYSNALPIQTIESHSSYSIAICIGDTISFAGDEIWMPGIYTDTLTSGIGCDSIVILQLSIAPPIVKFLYDTLCINENLIFNGVAISMPGIYRDTIFRDNGCDSMLELYVTAIAIDDSVTLNGNTIKAEQASGSYKWYNCNTGELIPQANSRTFTPFENGSYACIINRFDCVDTSACTLVTSVGLEDYNSSRYLLYPNPSKDNVYIEIPENAQLYGKLVDVNGTTIKQFTLNQRTNTLSVEGLSTGLYQIIVWDNNNTYHVFKFIKIL